MKQDHKFLTKILKGKLFNLKFCGKKKFFLKLESKKKRKLKITSYMKWLKLCTQENPESQTKETK